MTKKLWTGKTARQELVAFITCRAEAGGLSASEALEDVLYGAEAKPDGSPSREMLRWWDTASYEAQQRLMGQLRAALRRSDRLMNRKVAR